MKHVSLVGYPDENGFHPVDSKLFECDDVERVSILNANPHIDRSAAMVYRLRGAKEKIEEILDSTPQVLMFDVYDGGIDTFLFVYVEPAGVSEQFMEIITEYPIVPLVPIEVIDRGGFRVELVTTDEVLGELAKQLPDGLSIEIEWIKELGRDVIEQSLLTERQLEILAIAVENGYYSVPREVDQKALVDEFDITQGTLSEHLQKIETKIIRDYINRNLAMH